MIQVLRWKFWGVGYGLLAVIAILSFSGCSGDSDSNGAGRTNQPIQNPPGYGYPASSCENPIDLAADSRGGERLSPAQLKTRMRQAGGRYQVVYGAFHQEIRQANGYVVQRVFLETGIDLRDIKWNEDEQTSLSSSNFPGLKLQCVQNPSAGAWTISSTAFDNMNPSDVSCESKIRVAFNGEGSRMESPIGEANRIHMQPKERCFPQSTSSNEARSYFLFGDGTIEARIQKRGVLNRHTGLETWTTSAFQYVPRY